MKLIASSVEEEERGIALQSIPAGTSSPTASSFNETLCELLSVSVLTAQCLREIDNYRRGEPWTDEYGLELLRRAIVLGDQEAMACVQHCFGGLVRSWLCHHPKREAAGHLESDENYIAQTFERFWQATTLTQWVEIHSLAAALQYLRASLNGAILDTLRAYSRPGVVTPLEPCKAWEPCTEVATDSSEVWATLQTMLPNEREQRLAYLLFHCGLKPTEIVHFYIQEFGDVQEVYRMRRGIMERLLRDADQLLWR